MACFAVGLKVRGLGRLRRPSPLTTYKLLLPLSALTLLITSILKNLLIDHQPIQAYLSLAALLIWAISFTYELHKSPSPRIHFQNLITTALLSLINMLTIITVALAILWGIGTPFIPYLYLFVLTHLYFFLKTQEAKIFAISMTLAIIANMLRLVPIYPTPENASLSLIGYLTILLLHITISVLIRQIATKFPFLISNYWLEDNTKSYYQQLISDALKFRLIQHRINNLLMRLPPSSIQEINYALTQPNQTIDLSTALQKIKRKTHELEQIYSTAIKLKTQLKNSNKASTFAVLYLPLIYDLIENAAKHQQKNKPLKILVKARHNKLILEIINTPPKNQTAKIKPHSSLSDILSFISLNKLAETKITRRKSNIISKLCIPLADAPTL